MKDRTLTSYILRRLVSIYNIYNIREIYEARKSRSPRSHCALIRILNNMFVCLFI